MFRIARGKNKTIVRTLIVNAGRQKQINKSNSYRPDTRNHTHLT